MKANYASGRQQPQTAEQPQQPPEDKPMTYTTEIEEWLAVRKLDALKIDSETAEVMWCYGHTMDPYGIDPDLPEEYQQVGREYFARRPGSEVWVSFRDLPDKTRCKLWEQHKSKLGFPAGLFDFNVGLRRLRKK
jgi:hypothetical protein